MVEFADGKKAGIISRMCESLRDNGHRVPKELSNTEKKKMLTLEKRAEYLQDVIKRFGETERTMYDEQEIAALRWALRQIKEYRG